nr:hypothetical protein [Nostoc sp. EfeVER01]
MVQLNENCCKFVVMTNVGSAIATILLTKPIIEKIVENIGNAVWTCC